MLTDCYHGADIESRDPAPLSEAQPAESTSESSEDKAKPVGVTLRLTARQHEALRRVAFEQRTSINKLMRDGLAEVLRRHGR